MGFSIPPARMTSSSAPVASERPSASLFVAGPAKANETAATAPPRSTIDPAISAIDAVTFCAPPRQASIIPGPIAPAFAHHHSFPPTREAVHRPPGRKNRAHFREQKLNLLQSCRSLHYARLTRTFKQRDGLPRLPPPLDHSTRVIINRHIGAAQSRQRFGKMPDPLAIMSMITSSYCVGHILASCRRKSLPFCPVSHLSAHGGYVRKIGHEAGAAPKAPATMGSEFILALMTISSYLEWL